MVNLRIYVHDLKKTIGHSRALLELINHLPTSEVDSICVVSFTCDPLDEIFSSHKGKVSFQKVPFQSFGPVLVKIIFYQLYAMLDLFFRATERTQTLSIGLANPFASIIYIQFIHKQWKKRYLKSIPGFGLKYLYKKLLYEYLSLQEKIFYKNSSKQFICVANFISDYMKKHFKTKDSSLNLIYSGVNTMEFALAENSLEEAKQILKQSHSLAPRILESTKPIFLFVGAFERKGLSEALNWLSPVKDKVEFIVVGSPESDSKLKNLPEWVTHIESSNVISQFYAVADHFIFPTKYEPFGLVLIEAYIMGCNIITNLNEVGASELIKDEEGVFFLDQDELTPENFISKIELTEKIRLAKKRLEKIQGQQWSDRAIQFQEVIKKDSDNNLLSYLS